VALSFGLIKIIFPGLEFGEVAGASFYYASNESAYLCWHSSYVICVSLQGGWLLGSPGFQASYVIVDLAS
jgi:hypothetical protein